MGASLSILHLEDDPNDAELVGQTLRSAGIACSITLVQTREAFEGAIDAGAIDLVLADYSLPSFDGLSALRLVRARWPELPFILLSGSLGEEVAVDALKSGATDYVLKSRTARLAPAVRRAVQETDERSARYRAEDALQHSESLLQTLVESLAEGVLACDLDGNFLHWNKAALRLHGLDAMGDHRHFSEFVNQFAVSTLDGQPIAPEDWPLPLILRGQELRDHEVRIRELTAGRERILSYGGSIVHDADGQPTMAMLTMIDVTERKGAEQLLQQSEANFHRTIDCHVDGVVVTDVRGTVLFVNAAAIAMWQGDDTPQRWQRFAFRVSAGEVREVELPGAGGTRLIVDMRVVAVEWQGAPAYLVSLRDMTAQKQSEEDLRHASEQLQRVNRSLVDRNTEIQNFYHTLSHELKTPLTSAREFISMVMDGLAGPLSSHQQEFLGIAVESCDQLRLYVNDLLDVTRIETGKLSLEPQSQRLDALVQRAVETLAPAAAGKSLSLTWKSEIDLPVVFVDQHRILQVLTNLTTNAIKFTEPGGRVHLTVRQSPDSDGLCVSVADTGRGIPHEECDLIFTRLYQASRDALSSESRTGLGLGLYISQEIVQMHGGRIWVDSVPGEGSVFSFTLPTTPPRRLLQPAAASAS